MSTRRASRIGYILVCCILGVAFAVFPGHGDAGDHLVGIVGDDGTFIGKARVFQNDSSITLTKIDPTEKLGTIEVRFVADGVDENFSTEHVFLQWEKAHGLGRQWPLEGQKSFDKRQKTYRGTWNESASVTILDRSGGSAFKQREWDNIVRVKINGRRLVRHPPAVTSDESEAPSRDPDLGRHVASKAAERSPSASLAVPQVRPRSPSRPSSEAYGSWDHSDQKYEQLLKRIGALENSVASMRTWLLWGPVTVLALAALCGVIVWCFPAVRQALRQGPGPRPCTRADSLKLRPEFRFRNAG
jgi:hypothetical protein